MSSKCSTTCPCLNPTPIQKELSELEITENEELPNCKGKCLSQQFSYQKTKINFKKKYFR